MPKLHLAPGLSVDAAELSTKIVAALGMRGSGKSNEMAVIVEQLLGAGIQVVVLDSVGIWFSLRLKPDGKTPSGYDIPVLGGHHGDIPLAPTAGELVAKTLAETGSSAVLDTSRMRKGERARFAAALAETLLQAKQEHPSPLFFVVEESQRCIPQTIRFKGEGEERMLGAFMDIAEVGRNYGLGLGLVSQRPQKINKEVLNLTELLFAFQSNGVLERKALAEWVQETGVEGRDNVHGELPSLQTGEALVWSPSWLRLFKRVATPKKTTYDAGATPIAKRDKVKTKPLELEALSAAMATVVEEAKANDPKALKAEVARLRAELAKAGKAKAPAAPRLERVKVVPETHLRQLSAIAKRLQMTAVGLGTYVKAAHEMAADIEALTRAGEVDAARGRMVRPEDIVGRVEVAGPGIAFPLPESKVRLNKTATYGTPIVPAKRGDPNVVGFMSDLRPGELRLLSALQARHPQRLQRDQLAALACMSPTGGTYATYTGSLVAKGLIERDAGPGVGLTDAGLAAPTRPLPDKRGLVDEWKARKELGGKKKDILEAVATAHEVSVDELCERFEMTPTGGTWATYSGTLVGLGIVTRGNRSLIINPELAL